MEVVSTHCLESRLVVSILNYKTAALTIQCLDTVIPELADCPSGRVFVVDNCSGDGSAEMIDRAVAERGWAPKVEVLRAPVNGGFSAGNNIVFRTAPAKRYLLLNSDARIVPGAVSTLMQAMSARPDVGLVSPRIEHEDGQPQNTCYRFRTPLTEFLNAARTGPLSRAFPEHIATLPVPDEPIEPDWTSFACCLIRKEVIEDTGTLDEGYFMYFDDLDYCRRARDAGWRVLHRPDARVVHLRGQSGPVKKLTAERKRRPAYFYHSRNRYFAKFYGRAGLWTANILWEAGRGISLARELLRHKEPHTCQHESIDIWSNCWTPLAPPHAAMESCD